jgi:hypothetical protein
MPDHTGSVLGNPHPVSTPEKPKKCAICGVYHQRGETIALYRSWLWQQMQEDGAVLKELKRIAQMVKAGKDVRLGCWCKPAACHGDVIKAAVEWLIQTE